LDDQLSIFSLNEKSSEVYSDGIPTVNLLDVNCHSSSIPEYEILSFENSIPILVKVLHTIDISSSESDFPPMFIDGEVI
jgi:hypothetical protein